MERKIINGLKDCLERNVPVAVVTVISSSGSSPARVGRMMLVTSDSSVGSVGGGRLEQFATGEAVKWLAAGDSREIFFDSGSDESMAPACGGQVRLFVRVFGSSPRLLLIGAGHVGSELYNLGKNLGFGVAVIDDRKDMVEADEFAGAETFFVERFDQRLKEYVVGECYVAIATRSHETDQEAVESLIEADTRYIGLIGSSSKLRGIFSSMREKGIPEEKIKTLYAPMGLNIASRKPKEIAMSIMAEMLLVKNGGSPEHMRDVKKIDYV